MVLFSHLRIKACVIRMSKETQLSILARHITVPKSPKLYTCYIKRHIYHWGGGEGRV